MPLQPFGREAGENPAQSRYGERSHESASPVADHTVHARTFERKVGRTRATDRLDPSFDACRSEGFAIRRDPSESIPLRRFPCSRRSHRPREPRRPAGCRPSIAALVLILAACSGTAAPSTSPSAALASATPVATAAPTPSPSAAAAYPASLTDDEGTAVTIPAAPQKIVSLTPATTEILFALGAGDRVVATDDGSDFPTEAVALPDVATFSSVDTEKVVAAGADLVDRRRARLHAHPTPSPSCARSASRSWSSTRHRSRACSRTSR